MTKARSLLTDKLPGLEEEMIEYVESLARDSSLSRDERVEIVQEYLSSSFEDSSVDMIALAHAYLDAYEKEQIEQREIRKISPSPTEALAACLDVLRAPAPKVAPTSDEVIDSGLKKELIKMYDNDATLFAHDSEDEDEIMGLGRNENKTRIIKEREEARLNAKKEEEERKAEKVAQKLKSQAETIKSRTVSRKK
jgi:hypothetical protein